MLSPKEKAEVLVNELHEAITNSDGLSNKVLAYEKAKQCALIAVDECIIIHYNLESDRNGIGESHKYWQEVKQEICDL